MTSYQSVESYSTNSFRAPVNNKVNNVGFKTESAETCKPARVDEHVLYVCTYVCIYAYMYVYCDVTPEGRNSEARKDGNY
jgi:hypothetical protein